MSVSTLVELMQPFWGDRSVVGSYVGGAFVDGHGAPIDVRQLALQPRRVEVLTRELHERHRAPRKVHLLTRVHDVEEQARPVPVSAV